jgi:uncharacterized protein YjbJ (UPF0337 family)
MESVMATSWNRIAGKWKQFRGGLKQQWGKLTNNELLRINGSHEVLEGEIQERYGVVKSKTSY